MSEHPLDLPDDELVPSHVIGEIFRKMDSGDDDGSSGVREPSRPGPVGPTIEGEAEAAGARPG